jgi:hypothetical protein
MTEVKRVYCPNCNRIMSDKWTSQKMVEGTFIPVGEPKEEYRCGTCEPEYRKESSWELRELFDDDAVKKQWNISDIDDSEMEEGR